MRPVGKGAMTPKSTDPPAAAISLRAVARVREIDRRLYSIQFTRRGLKWVAFPGFGVLGVLILQRVLATGVESTTANVLGGAFMLLMAATGFVQSSRVSREAVAALEAERASIMAGEKAVRKLLIP
jgi:hypothetical protein